MALPGDWPFDVRRVPVFYGWIVWLVSTVGFLMSIPGQTMGVAVFTDTLIEVLGLSRTQLSVAYLAGTVMSALLLTRAGRLYDRVGARIVVIVASVALALTLVAISVLDIIAGALAGLTGLPLATWSFPAIVVCYFGVRFAGQGVLTNAVRNVLLVWFEKRRGLVAGARGVFVAFGFSLSPLVIALLIDAWGWRGALVLMAAVIGLGYSVVALVFLRDTPESCGVSVDGKREGGSETGGAAGPVVALSEARRSPVFWMYAIGLAAYGLFVTAVTFHIVAIFAEAGRTATEAFAYFLPIAVVSTCVNLTSSWLADTRELKPFLLLLITGLVVGPTSLLYLEYPFGYWLAVVGFGTGGGLWGLVSNLSFIRHFGRVHLGEITGFNMSVSVFASALGPVFFSTCHDAFGSYEAPITISIAAACVLFTAALRTDLAEPRPASGA